MRRQFKQSVIISALFVAIAIPVSAQAENIPSTQNYQPGLLERLLTPLIGEQPKQEKTGPEKQGLLSNVTETVQDKLKNTLRTEQTPKKEIQPETPNLNNQIVTPRPEQKLTTDQRTKCDRKQPQINKLMDTMDSRRQDIFTQITKVFDATRDFYAKKNLRVDGYDKLVIDIRNTKSAASSAIIMQQQISTFDCASDTPRTDLTTFHERRLASINAVKSYRDAVLSFIKTVRSAADNSKAGHEA